MSVLKVRMPDGRIVNMPVFKGDVNLDLTYDPESENAQSGKAVAEGIYNAEDEVKTELKEYSNGNFANALKGSKSGEAVVATDVSPAEHKLSVKLTSDSMTDFSAVSVSRLGKNLFDISKITNTNDITNNGDGSLTVSAYPSSTRLKLKELCPTLKIGDIVTLNFDTNSTAGQLYLSSPAYWTRKTAKTITEDILNSVVYFYCKRVDGVNSDATISNIQIELGDTATDYEEYKEPQTVTADSDGTAEGLTSLSPNITLVTDTAGVTMDCEYSRDINKAFAELQQAIISLGGNI